MVLFRSRDSSTLRGGFLRGKGPEREKGTGVAAAAGSAGAAGGPEIVQNAMRRRGAGGLFGVSDKTGPGLALIIHEE